MGAPTNYYVDAVDGSDLNAGTSPGEGNAWATLQHALDNITPDADGDQINIKGTQSLSFVGPSPPAQAWVLSDYGTPTQHAPLIIRGYTSTANDGGSATIEEGNHGITFGGSEVNWVHFADVFFNGDSGLNQHFHESLGIGCSFHRCRFRGTGTTALIQLDAETSIFFQDCLFEKYTYAVRAMGHSDLHFSNCVFRRNNGSSSVGNSYGGIFGDGSKSKIYVHRCIFDSNTTGGNLGNNPEISTGGRSVTVRNCSFYNPDDNVKWIVKTSSEGTRLVFLNNLIEGYGGTGAQVLYSSSSKDWYLVETGGNSARDYTAWKDANLHTFKDWGDDQLPVGGSSSVFVDAANDDFTPVPSTLDSKFSVPGDWPKVGAAASKMDRGAIQRNTAGTLVMPSERGLHPVDWGSV